MHRPSELEGSLVQHLYSTAEGFTAQADEPSTITALSFSARNPSKAPHHGLPILCLYNCGLLIHSYVLGKPNYSYSLHSRAILLLTLNILPGRCCPFPNAPKWSTSGQMPPLPWGLPSVSQNDISWVSTVPCILRPLSFPHLRQLLVSGEFSLLLHKEDWCLFISITAVSCRVPGTDNCGANV